MPSLDATLSDSLDALARGGLTRVQRTWSARRGALIDCGDRALVDFSSNDYLGLSSAPDLVDSWRALRSEIGAGAARLISGNRSEHDALEAAIAAFKRTESALLFGSGYLANLGAIPALADRGDVIYADQDNHASLIDGCRLSRAEVRVYPHGDMAALSAMLNQDEGRFARRWIVTDGVFSMSGDLAPLPALTALARQHDAWLYVDDAHGTGVLGATGRGIVEHYGLERGGTGVDVLMGTLGKAVGVAGAFLAGSRTLIEYLRHRARTAFFTTAMPAALARAGTAGLAAVAQRADLREKLRGNTLLLHSRLARLGHVDAEVPQTPILPLILGASNRAMQVGNALFGRGYQVGVIRPPTVPAGTSRLRITVTAVHTVEQIAGFAAAIDDVLAATPA